MNTTVPTLAQISGDDWKTDAGALRDGLDQVSVNLASAFHAEHNPNNTHSTIHASGTISERKRTTPMGEWINVPFDATAFAMALAGNSWTVPGPVPGASFYVIAYMLIGKTMWLNLDVPRSNLTVGTPFNQITVKMPPGYRIAGVSTAGAYVGRTAYGKVGLVNGGVAAGGFISASPGDTTLTIQKDDGSNFVADAALGFTLRAQLFMEVETV